MGASSGARRREQASRRRGRGTAMETRAARSLGFAIVLLALRPTGGATREGDPIIINDLAPSPPPAPPPPLAVAAVSPRGGAPAGGTRVLVTGTSFAAGAAVTFGTAAATSVTRLSSTALAVVAPAGTGTVSVTVTNPDATSVTLPFAFTYAAPATASTSLAAGARAEIGSTLTFTVTATDPGSGNVNLRLLNPPPACQFTPRLNATSPATGTVRWPVQAVSGGLQPLLFRAENASTGSGTVLTVWVQVFGSGTPVSLVTADVTGDGIPDTIATARAADVGLSANAGALYVWVGTPEPDGPPTAVLTASGASNAGAMLGSATGQGVQVAEVTGDGIPDIVAGAWGAAGAGGVTGAGAIYVFAGGTGLSGTVTETAVLRAAAPSAGDGLGVSGGLGIVCADVTGDGTLDVVAGAQSADAGAVDAGALYVWAGGSGLTGAVTPTATCVVVSPTAQDYLGLSGIQCVDVTGDGTLDLVTGSYQVDTTVANAGAVMVFAGGSGLTGTVNPTATLQRGSPTANDSLGYPGWFGGVGIQFGEVTGDSTPDIVVGGAFIDTTVSDAGAVLVWAGGSGLTGTPSPTATLALASPTAGDYLGTASGGGLQLAEVTGDSTADVVVAGYTVDGSVANEGAVLVWAGGSGLTGTPSPTARCAVPSATANDQLSYVSVGEGVLVVDVTGDGTRDLVVGGSYIDTTVTDAGAVLVWAGGSGLTGTPSPTATLRVASPTAGDYLGWAAGASLVADDVSGDGTLDVIAGAMNADDGGVANTGLVYVWNGGTGLSGTLSPSATCRVAGAALGDQLGSATGLAIQVADVTGDGTRDLVVGAAWADRGASNAGAVYVWAGGTGLSGTVTPTATCAQTFSAGQGLGSASGQAVQLGDVTGDGVPDVVATAAFATIGGYSTGVTLVFAGGSGLTGAPPATAVLRQPVTASLIPQNIGYTGFGTGQGVLLADVTGDGALDVVAAAPGTDRPAPATDVGACFLWAGGSSLTGTLAATAILRDPNGAPFDRLGE